MPLTLHPLTLRDAPHGAIRFRHEGATREFHSVINEMTGDRMSWFGTEAPTINDTLSWVRSVFRDIHALAEVLETAGPLAGVRVGPSPASRAMA